MDWLSAPLVWLAIAVLLLIAEVLGTSGFLLGAAVAAFVMTALVFLVPGMGIGMQIFIYAVISVIATVIYFKFFRATQPPNEDELPSRAEAMLGRRFKLEESISAGNETRIQIGDSMWVISSLSDIAEGVEVEVVDCDSMRLQVATLN